MDNKNIIDEFNNIIISIKKDIIEINEKIFQLEKINEKKFQISKNKNKNNNNKIDNKNDNYKLRVKMDYNNYVVEI